MINNSGIINNGNNNVNIIDNSIDYNMIINELNILKDYSSENINIGLEYAKRKDTVGLKKFLKTLQKDSIELIKKLSLTALEKLIEKIIF